jgi:hexosaminidase
VLVIGKTNPAGVCAVRRAFLIDMILGSMVLVSVTQAGINLVPQPVNLRETGGRWELEPSALITYADETAKDSAEMLASYLRPATGFKLPVSPGGKGDIVFRTVEDDIPGSEGYTVRIAEHVSISAQSQAGLFYGGQTLRQLLPVEIFSTEIQSVAWVAPGVEIRDWPRFDWRGQHLDVARHFMPVEWVKQFIDRLALHKLNVMHWHLTEDQGWRIEIKKYPKLTEVGAWRKETLIGHRSEKPAKYDGTPYGGFYTQDEIREVVEYARQRHVTIVPEIEIPGHSLSALAAYPALGCTGGPYEVLTKWGISKDIYCAGNPDTFIFWKDVLDEVCELFPSEYIHTGGDEAPKSAWEKCAKCQNLMKEVGAADEHALQVYVTQEMEKHLAAKGRRLIGWDEIFEDGLSTSAVVMWWHKNKAKAILEKGNGMVVATSKALYFDKSQGKDKTKEPLSIGGYIPIEKVYALEPVPEGVTAEQAKLVLGAQGQLWTEYIPTTSHAEYMLYPRQCALSEMLWLPAEQKDYADFTKRLNTHVLRLKHQGVNYRDPAKGK